MTYIRPSVCYLDGILSLTIGEGSFQMALHHFKTDFYKNQFDQNKAQLQQNKPLSASFGERKPLMLNGVNLGDIMKRTINEEINKINQEKKQTFFRNGGS